MDFSKLRKSERHKFLDLAKPNGIKLNYRQTDKEKASELFNQLKDKPNFQFPVPIVDLFIAHHYSGPRNQTYNWQQIKNLTKLQIESFNQIFNSELTPERIYRILKYLNLIDEPSINLLLQEGILQILCETLPIQDLNNFRKAAGQKILYCKVPIADPDQKINHILNVNTHLMYLYEDILNDGSILTYLSGNDELLSWGLELNLLERVKHWYEASEMGDLFESRLEAIIMVTGSKARLIGTEKIKNKNMNERPWIDLDADKNNSYEITLWMSAMQTFTQEYPTENISLEIDLRNSESEIPKIMNEVLPQLTYKIIDQKLIIPLDDIAQYFN